MYPKIEVTVTTLTATGALVYTTKISKCVCVSVCVCMCPAMRFAALGPIVTKLGMVVGGEGPRLGSNFTR